MKACPRILPALVLVAAAHAPVAPAVDTLQVLALTRDRVILAVDGERRVLAVGEASPEGVVLLEASSAHALVRVDGQEQRLEPGPVTTPVGIGAGSDGAAADTLVLWADARGFFHVDGRINGRPVQFLVDTGATSVAISGRTARELGLDLSDGQRGLAQTAGGIVGMTGVTLDELSLGAITLYNVSAGVVDGDHPAVPLLGANVLNRLDMRRDGQRMELSRK